MTNPPTPDELMEFYQQQGVTSVEEAEMWNKLLGIHYERHKYEGLVTAYMTCDGLGVVPMYIKFNIHTGVVDVPGLSKGYRISVS